MKYTGFYSRIYFRNCEIINHSDFCVFCVDETAEYSGAKKALAKCNVPFVNLQFYL